MPGLFNAFRFVDGELVQFDEIINSTQPAPTPKPVSEEHFTVNGDTPTVNGYTPTIGQN